MLFSYEVGLYFGFVQIKPIWLKASFKTWEARTDWSKCMETEQGISEPSCHECQAAEYSFENPPPESI